ncbi:glycosyltransferase [uncultured Flavobacterium sp.]|uniref:glycosyltransferase family 4 protein n=1 Tax=uncultured Flavobacterium sp. TaxID=165435 RepID=UPI0030EEEFFA|tara:strand:- start:78644 stop:79738 length:1095 start_codon:yes stop_codon:yes gene_type:complete
MGKINFIDLSVYDRNIKSISNEKRLTRHSLGYLDFLSNEIRASIVRFGGSFQEADNYKLYRYNIIDLMKFYRFFKSSQNSVVLFHSFSFPIRYLICKYLFRDKVKWIIQHHAGEPSKNRFKSFIQKIAYSKADAYLFVSKEQASSYIKKGLIKKKEQVYEIMECSTPFVLKNKLICRNKLELGANSKIFIWVGGLDKNKDPMTMLKAIKQHENKGNIFLVFMFFNRENLLDEVQHFIVENNLEETVFLKGKIDNSELEDWYNASDFYISCSFTEGSGIAMAEATACGCIPIVSNIPSFEIMTDNGNIGYHFEKGDYIDLANKLILLDSLELDSERIRVSNMFREKTSFEAIGLKMSHLIKKLKD